MTALHFLKQKNDSLIVIMPTGSGKSALFQVASSVYNPNCITILITPFVALVQQALQLGTNKSQKVTEYKPSTAHLINSEEGQLLVVSADYSQHSRFVRYVVISLTKCV